MRKLLLVLCLAACGGGSSSTSTPDATPPADADPNVPHVTRVSWQHAAGCTNGTANGVTITAEVTDADTSAAMLTYQGSGAGCTGQMTTNPSTGITCPEVEPYPWTLTVMDPQGHAETVSFTISPCTNSSKSF